MTAYHAHDLADLPGLLAAAVRSWPDDAEREWMLAAWAGGTASTTGHAEPGGFMSFRFCAEGRELTIFREHSSFFLRGATIETLS